MTENAVELAEEAVAYRLLGDALLARSKDLARRAADAMGRGTLYPKLADGTELACFNVPADAETVTIDVDALLPFVKRYYPTEVMETVRPAFVEVVRETTRDAKTPCVPNGEDGVPGVFYHLEPKSPRITAKEAGKLQAQSAVDRVLAEALSTFTGALEIAGHVVEIEGEK